MAEKQRETELVFIHDTETTDLIDFKAPPWDQPSTFEMIQVAGILVDCKDDYKIVDKYQSLIITTVPSQEKALESHGISFEKSQTEGKPFLEVMDKIESMLDACDYVSCHNTGYDTKVIATCSCRAHFKRHENEATIPDWVNPYPKWAFCTMKGNTNIVMAPKKPNPKTGKIAKGFKWPTLQETYKHYTGEEFEGAHDAMVDVMATYEVFKHTHSRMMEVGKWPGLWCIANKELADQDRC